MSCIPFSSYPVIDNLCIHACRQMINSSCHYLSTLPKATTPYENHLPPVVQPYLSNQQRAHTHDYDKIPNCYATLCYLSNTQRNMMMIKIHISRPYSTGFCVTPLKITLLYPSRRHSHLSYSPKRYFLILKKTKHGKKKKNSTPYSSPSLLVSFFAFIRKKISQEIRSHHGRDSTREKGTWREEGFRLSYYYSQIPVTKLIADP